MPGADSVDQGFLHHERPPRHISQQRAGLHASEPGGVEQPPRCPIQRQRQHDDIGFGKQPIEAVGRPQIRDILGFLDGEHVGCQDPRLEDAKDLGQSASHTSKADDAHGGVGQIARRTPDELFLLLRPEEDRQAAAPAGHQGDGVLGDLIGQHAGGTGDDHVRFDHRRHQAVIHTGGGGLDPMQPALSDYAVPIDGDFGVSAKHVGIEQFAGHPFLAGVDNFSPRHCRGDLLAMAFFDRIAEDDAHENYSRNGR